MREVVIKPAAQETLADRFTSRLRDLAGRLNRFRGELLAIERDAAAAGFPLEPAALLLGRLERAAAAQQRTMEHHAANPLQFRLDLPEPAEADHDGP